MATTESISLDNAHKPEESKKPSISVAGINDGKRTDAVLKNISSSDSKKYENEEKSKTNNDDDSSNNEEVPKKSEAKANLTTVEEAFLPAEVSANKVRLLDQIIF